MITVRDVDVRVGALPLLSGVSFHVSPGDRIGLVGLPRALGFARAGRYPHRRREDDRVFHLDPGRAALDIHNTGWDAYLEQRDADERRRTRERANAERKAALHAQADKMRARVATAVAARNMARRADRLLADLETARHAAKPARIRLPAPAPCGRVPLGAVSLTRSYGSQAVLRGVDLAVDRGSRLVVLGPNGAGKSPCCASWPGRTRPTAAGWSTGTVCAWATSRRNPTP
ncbi:ATPase subunit of ABC transporter with duplicated ATPase domains [Streptomyces luteogriseus]|uniref:ATPase subunit of ABC transporter with duplicated ATPase domains n=1 Tax=Streptomyces luteogriseus TaxID=68233 RepID=A0A7W7DK56_9ACTN|nr:hypothetical protein [Streptomyces luteogriseus]MBB4710787.1 ATPase subunit of ABC transporter with duplicated ATPase domains [Streptomyces luteogriseus]